MSINNINLVGTAVADYKPIKDTFGVFRMVNNYRRNSEESLFIDIKVFDKLAEICYDHIKKGTKVEVSGRLTFRETEKDGRKYQDYSIIANDVHFTNTFEKEEA
jgi:single-stranded DNA-binding protein